MDNKILFVDDDVNILDAYKRQLKRQFQVETAQGGEEGLNTIKDNGPYAVIISDLRMPGMDGNQFLARVKEIAPESVRMMLTGFADLKTAMDAINRGNIFRLMTKPCTKEVLAEALADGIEQYRKNIISENKAVNEEARQKKRVMIVDDDRVIIRIITNGLREHPELEVVAAQDGKEAIDRLNNEEIDLIVTDLYMPVVNGLQLLSYISKNYPGIPAMVLTGHGSTELEARVKAIGDFQYYEKPMDVNVLSEIIIKALYSPPAGQIHGISTASFLQLIDIEEKVCTLKIRSGEKFGRLYFNKGELMAAETGKLKGEQAAFDIISWENSMIEIENVCKKNRREINKSLMHILMEGARLRDEIGSEAVK